MSEIDLCRHAIQEFGILTHQTFLPFSFASAAASPAGEFETAGLLIIICNVFNTASPRHFLKFLLLLLLLDTDIIIYVLLLGVLLRRIISFVRVITTTRRSLSNVVGCQGSLRADLCVTKKF